MGKSDEFVFAEYRKLLSDSLPSSLNSIAFLGFSQENNFTRIFNSSTRHFYDLSIGNWNINDAWKLKQNYDFIVCTRCAYFCKNPKEFIQRCKDNLTAGGLALIDWGLGDHWRFKDYKVGWVRNGEHEFAYNQNNFLYSCFWNEELTNRSEVQAFWNAVKNNSTFGYKDTDTLNDVVKKEVPELVEYDCKKIATKFLWPESPQLYIMTLIEK
jgi:SAM-dependent methyltransferase